MLFAEIDADGWVKIIGALGLLVVSYFQFRLVYQVKQVKEAADRQHELTNSRLDQLVEATRISAEAVGVLRGRAQVTAEQAAESAAVVESEKEKNAD